MSNTKMEKDLLKEICKDCGQPKYIIGGMSRGGEYIYLVKHKCSNAALTKATNKQERGE